MKSATRFFLLAAAAVMMAGPSASAQTTLATQNLSVSANLGSRASLTLGSATLTFPDADPATVSTLTAPLLTVGARARVAPGTAVSLTVLAGGDFVGPSTIPASDISWTAAGDASFVGGILNTTTAQSLAAFTGPGAHNGTQTYSMPNDWAYAPGAYAMTVTYTLSIP
jgi:hypothetical protein